MTEFAIGASIIGLYICAHILYCKELCYYDKRGIGAWIFLEKPIEKKY